MIGLRWSWLRVALNEVQDFKTRYPNESADLLWRLHAQKDYIQQLGHNPECRQRGTIQALGAYTGGTVAIWLFFAKASKSWLALHLAVIETAPQTELNLYPPPPAAGWELAKTRSIESTPKEVMASELGSN